MFWSNRVSFLILLLVVSLSLDTYYTWRLSVFVRENHAASLSAKQKKYSSQNYSEKSFSDCQKILEETKKLARLIDDLSLKINKIQEVEAVALSNQDQGELWVSQRSNLESPDSNMESISQISRILKRSTSNSRPIDEWFWSQAEEAEGAVPFEVEHLDDELVLESVICRGEWCRVEMEDLRDNVPVEAADLDLQLRINRGLGRDTTMVMGSSEGSTRVIYVK